MRPILDRSRSFLLLLAFAIAPFAGAASAQAPCGGTISGDVAVVSVTTGGTQTLTLGVPAAEARTSWHLLGSFAGTAPGSPFLSSAQLFLNEDRYFYSLVTGTSRLVQGGAPSVYGPMVPFNAQGQATLQVVVPPIVLSHLVGRTVHHGYYRFNPLTLLPECGSATVALTFGP